MKRRFAVVLGMLLIMAVAVAVGCDSSEPVTSSTGGAGAATTTVITSGGGDLDAYRAEMREWVDKHEAELTSAAGALDSIEDPTAASEEEAEAVRTFAGLMDDVVKDLGAIEPTSELSSAHADFLASLEGMANGLDQMAGAMESKSMTDFFTAMTTMAADSEKGAAAQAVLEEALGFSLLGEGSGQGVTDSTAVETTEAGGPGSREEPMPLGQAAQIGQWQVKVVSVDPDATGLITSDEWSDPPQAGNQYVLVTLEATYTGSESASFWADMTYSFVGSKGNTFGEPKGFAVSPSPIFEAGEAFSGASITGDALFEVASDQVVGGVIMIEEFTYEGERVFFAIE